MTRFEQIKLMNIDELSKWLDAYGQFDGSPWMDWFDGLYCQNCPSIICHYENGYGEFPCCWCEINDKCKFFPEMDEMPNNKEIIKMWLESEVKE